MPDIVKVSWSGGKDSTCAVFKHLERGNIVKAVCYIPMFTDDIPLIMPDHYDFILETAECINKLGGSVHIVSGMTYYDFFYYIKSKGDHVGKIMGFPSFIKRCCQFKNRSKLVALKRCDVGYFDYEDVGIAFDEFDRYGQLNDKFRSILVEEELTEADCFKFCYTNGFLSPVYYSRRRDGCALCPHASPKEYAQWLACYPQAVTILLQMQQDSRRYYPDRTPLRNGRWFIAEGQQNIFGDISFDY